MSTHLIEPDALRRALLPSLMVLALSGCSSGSDRPALYDRPAVGAYAGSDFRGSPGSNAFRMAVLGNGEYWLLHGDYSASAFVLRGFLTGPNVAPYAGGFTTGSMFGLPTPGPANMSTLYDAAYGSVSGSITTGVPIFSLSFSGVAYAPSAGAIAGPWTVTDLRGANVNLDIAGNGQFSATTQSACIFTGSFSASQSVAGLLLVDIVDPRFCLGNAQRYGGVAFTESTFATGRQQLLIAATGGGYTAGTGLYGVR